MIDLVLGPADTKGRILQVARKLFSEHGYEGASIRKIAQESGVNLAAVHYHFKNKENLFWAIIGESFDEAERVCAELAVQSKDLIDFSMKVFDHFHENRALMRNTMRLLLSNQIQPPKESPCAHRMSDGVTGPPGGKYFGYFLQKELATEISETAILWGVKSIFGAIVHWTTMCASVHFETMACRDPLLSSEQIRKDVEHIVWSTVNYLRLENRSI